MSRLPIIAGKELIRLLEKKGWEVRRQKGSHIIMHAKNDPTKHVTIPNHGAIKKGTLLSILRTTGLKREDFE